MLVDLDDTHRCPTGPACACCGTGPEPVELTVVTALSGAGVLCVSLCAACLVRPLAVAGPAAVRGVVEHCDHLAISMSEMNDALASGWSW